MEWQDLYRAINAQRKHYEMNGEQARTLASQVWEDLKDKVSQGGMTPSDGMHVHVPVTPVREIDEGAGLEIAEGIVEYLLEHAERPSSREILEARSRQVLSKARGPRDLRDGQTQHQLGYHIGELMVLLVVEMELDWDDLQHHDLRDWTSVPGRGEHLRILPEGDPVPLNRQLPPGIGLPPTPPSKEKGTLESILTSPVTSEAVKILGDLVSK